MTSNVHTAFTRSDRDIARSPESRIEQDNASVGALVRHGLWRLKARLQSIWIRCLERKTEHETTAALRALDDRVLRDIGIDRHWIAAQMYTQMTPVRDTGIQSRRPLYPHHALRTQRPELAVASLT